MAKIEWDKDFITDEKEFITTYQETGVIGFDLAISNGRGLPVGGCILMYSAPGSGKSTLCADIAKRLLDKNEKAGNPYQCLYIDIEGGSKGLALNNGLSKYVSAEHGKRLIYRRSKRTTWNDVENMFRAILDKDEHVKDVRLVIIDSISAIMSETQADLKSDINKGDFGSGAKDRNILFNKYLLELKSKGVSFLLIAQQRQKQGATAFEDQKRAATADGDDHIVDCILKLTRSGGGNNVETKKVEVVSAATGEKEKVSTQFFCKIAAPNKNRFCAGLPAVPVLVRIGQGIVNRYTMRNLLETNNLLKIGGSAQKRKVTISDELVTFVGGEEPFVQESDLRTTNAWIARNVEPIKEFLKSRNLYRLIPDVDMLQAQQGQDDTEDDDE